MPILRKISTRIKYFKICRALGCGGILGRQFCNVTNKPKAQEIIKLLYSQQQTKTFYVFTFVLKHEAQICVSDVA